MDLKIEKSYWEKGYKNVVGLDEAGRGPLAGPVYAASVVIVSDKIKKLNIPDLKIWQEIKFLTKDSKKMSPASREKVFNLIQKCPVIEFAYSSVDQKIIDKINIEKASHLAMKKSLDLLSKKIKLNLSKTILLLDGNRIMNPNLKIKFQQKAIIKGDDKIISISLASIIAKVMRDKKMFFWDKKYPQYKFAIHKGYPTLLHFKMLKKYGPCNLHRFSYKPVIESIKKHG